MGVGAVLLTRNQFPLLIDRRLCYTKGLGNSNTKRRKKRKPFILRPSLSEDLNFFNESLLVEERDDSDFRSDLGVRLLRRYDPV